MIEAFDYAILELYHGLAEAAGGFFTPLAKFVTFIGENGIWLFALSGILMCFAKTRKIGVCIFGAVSCGTMISTFILKDWVARIRPCDIEQFRDWWITAGANVEEGFSFPSGHATVAAAGMTGLALIWKKKVLWFGVPYTILMCMSRNYLMAHYPSDVIAGVCVGVFSGIVAYLITLGIYAFLERFKENVICRWILVDIDAVLLFKKLFKRNDDGK